MGFNAKELSRRRAIALAAGLTTAVLPIWGTALAVAHYIGGSKNEERKGEAQPSATESLMTQHGVLLRILNVYADLAHRLQAGAADIDTIALLEAAQLFRDFGEDYHERMLEEDYVFPELSEAGGPNAKLVEVLLNQHQRGREITDYLCQVGSRGTIAGEGEPLAKALTSMTRMFRAHLALEDTVVFPAWKALQSRARLEEMAGRFEDIGQERFGQDGFERAVERIAKIEQTLGLQDIAAFTAPPPREV
jgi:hemerythrin-like domain-containing protein